MSHVKEKNKNRLATVQFINLTCFWRDNDSVQTKKSILSYYRNSSIIIPWRSCRYLQDVCNLVYHILTEFSGIVGNQNFLMYNHNTARLDEWVRRELSAISRTGDVGVLVSLVQSLALRASLIGGRVPQNWSDRSQQDQEAINQLRRFLANETEHFWHELRYII